MLRSGLNGDSSGLRGEGKAKNVVLRSWTGGLAVLIPKKHCRDAKIYMWRRMFEQR